MFYWAAIILTAIDQITKLFVRRHIEVGETRLIREGWLYFTHYQNSGAARSTFQGYGRYFGILAALFIIGVLIYRRRRADGRGLHLQDTGLAFLVAGAAGNGIERLYAGKVTDFLQFGSNGGILNIADLFINIGVVLVIVQQLFFSGQRR